MNKLLSFLLSSLILMNSSVVTLAETVESEITGKSKTVEITPSLSIKAGSWNQSSNEDTTSIEITSTNDFSFTVPDAALVYSWDKTNLKTSIKLSDNFTESIINSNLKFINRSDAKRKVELKFSINSNIKIKSGKEEEFIVVKKDGVKVAGSRNSTVYSFEIDFEIGDNVEKRTSNIYIGLNLESIDFDRTISISNIQEIISTARSLSLFTLTISLVIENESGS